MCWSQWLYENPKNRHAGHTETETSINCCQSNVIISDEDVMPCVMCLYIQERISNAPKPEVDRNVRVTELGFLFVLVL